MHHEGKEPKTGEGRGVSLRQRVRIHGVSERDPVPVEARRAHVDRGAGIVGGEPQQPAQRLDRFDPAQQQSDAARGVATRLDLAPVRIPDPHARIGPGGRLDQDELIAADPLAPIGNGARARGIDRDRVGPRIRSEEHTSELSPDHLVCRLLLEIGRASCRERV